MIRLISGQQAHPDALRLVEDKLEEGGEGTPSTALLQNYCRFGFQQKGFAKERVTFPGPDGYWVSRSSPPRSHTDCHANDSTHDLLSSITALFCSFNCREEIKLKCGALGGTLGKRSETAQS